MPSTITMDSKPKKRRGQSLAQVRASKRNFKKLAKYIRVKYGKRRVAGYGKAKGKRGWSQ